MLRAIRDILRDLRCKCFRPLCACSCRDRFFNRDASLEIDRLLQENDRLRDLVKNGGKP